MYNFHLSCLYFIISMNFCESFPIVHYNSNDFLSTNKLKIHSTAQLGEVANIKSSGRVWMKRTLVRYE